MIVTPVSALDLPEPIYKRVQRVEDIAEFRETEGSWPSSAGATERERTLARYVRALRDEPQHPAVSERVRELLGELPAKANRGSGIDLATALAQFEAEHGHSPKSRGATAEERSLAKRAYRAGAKPAPRAKAAIEAKAPTGRGRKPDLDRFASRVRELIAARDRLGYWPRRSSADKSEQDLAYFRFKLREPLSIEKADVLFELDPQLARWALDRRDRKSRGLEHDLPLIAEHIEKHGRRPRHEDADPEVRRLARRLSTIRKEGVTDAERVLVNRWLPKLQPPSVAEARARRGKR